MDVQPDKHDAFADCLDSRFVFFYQSQSSVSADLPREDAAAVARQAWTSAIECNLSAGPSLIARSFKVCPCDSAFGGTWRGKRLLL